MSYHSYIIRLNDVYGADTVSNIGNAMVGDAEINFVVTLLENTCLSRQITQMKDFLFSLHSGELNSLFSTCSFHVPNPWASSIGDNEAVDEESSEEKKAESVLKDRLHNDENSSILFDHVKYILSRAFVSRPFALFSKESNLGVESAELLFDMLLSATSKSIWGLYSLFQHPMSLQECIGNQSRVILSSPFSFSDYASTFGNQISSILIAASHELRVNIAFDAVLQVFCVVILCDLCPHIYNFMLSQNIHFPYVKEMYSGQYAKSLHVYDAVLAQSVHRHVEEYDAVEELVYSTIAMTTNECAREDIQIQAAILGQYVDFWKCRFNCQLDMAHSQGQSEELTVGTGRRNDGIDTVVLEPHLASERLRTVPLGLVKDWLEVSSSSFDELFRSSLPAISHLRTDVAIERRLSIISSLSIVYRTAVDNYDPCKYDDFGCIRGPEIVNSILKGKNYSFDRSNVLDNELKNWLNRVNGDTAVEFLNYLGLVNDAIKSIKTHIEEVMSLNYVA